MIAILDYGLGNIRAFANVYQRLGFPYCVAREASALDSATHVILPGVGAFDEAVSRLNSSGLRSCARFHCWLRSVCPSWASASACSFLARGSEEGSAQGTRAHSRRGCASSTWSDLLHRATAPAPGLEQRFSRTGVRPISRSRTRCAVSTSCTPTTTRATTLPTFWLTQTTVQRLRARSVEKMYLAYNFTPRRVTTAGRSYFETLWRPHHAAPRV